MAVGEIEDGGKDKDTQDELQVEARRAKAFGVEEHQGGGGDESDDGEAQHAEYGVDNRVVTVLREEAQDKQHSDDGQYDNGERGEQRADDPLPGRQAAVDHGGVADISGSIDADGARRHLADGEYIGELADRKPIVFHHHLVLDKCNHRVSTAESEDANFEERQEDADEKHRSRILLR